MNKLTHIHLGSRRHKSFGMFPITEAGFRFAASRRAEKGSRRRRRRHLVAFGTNADIEHQHPNIFSTLRGPEGTPLMLSSVIGQRLCVISVSLGGFCSAFEACLLRVIASCVFRICPGSFFLGDSSERRELEMSQPCPRVEEAGAFFHLIASWPGICSFPRNRPSPLMPARPLEAQTFFTFTRTSAFFAFALRRSLLLHH